MGVEVTSQFAKMFQTKEKIMKKAILAIVLFAGCSDNSSYVPTTSSNSNSFEHNYVKNRMKLEGYSDKDSETATKAILKFHEAQKRR